MVVLGQVTPIKVKFLCFYSFQDHGDTGFVERRYGGVPARDAALVIQRAYRR